MTDRIVRAAEGSAAGENPGPHPTLGYWHAWVDEGGVSHQTRCTLDSFELKGVGPGVQPQWNHKEPEAKSVVTFTVLPVGWYGEWHENPKPQWIAPISGRWFVETMDGTRVEMGPGDLELGEDQNCRTDARGHKGHLSGTVGDEPCVLMVVGLDVAPTVARPCRAR